MNPIRVQICDDNPHIRVALQQLLAGESDMTVVGEAASGEELIEKIEAASPNVLVLDIRLAGRSGIALIPEIEGTAPGTKVLVLSMQNDPSYARQALAAGASGYLMKDAVENIAEAIREVASGRTYVHPSFAVESLL